MDYSLESIFADIEYKLNKVVDRMSEKALSLLKEIIEEEIDMDFSDIEEGGDE